MKLAARALAEERMDAPDLDPAVYAAVLGDLARVNSVTMGRRPTLAFLARATRGRSRTRLLDVGFGDGDMLRAIARWAGRRGVAIELVGVDLNPRGAAIARAATPEGMAIDYRTGDHADQGDFDLIISSLVAHHMSHDQLLAFLGYMERHAAAGWFINDLHRHRLAYLGFPPLARLMGWHPIVREDGALSIARGYRPAEWPPILAQAGVEGARVFRAFPFRLCVEKRR